MLTMNSGVLEQWTGALESGRYRKGIGYLGRKTSVILALKGSGYEVIESARILHCPLGVLCEVAVAALVIPPARWSAAEGVQVATYDGQQGNLPRSVMEWAGLETTLPMLRIPVGGILDLPRQFGPWVSISNINDHTNTGLAGIGKLIRGTYALADAS